MNFKTRGIDFYHLNYTMGDGKPYYVPLFLDTGKIKIVSHIENDKLVIDSVIGSPMYEKYSRWRSEYTLLKQNAISDGANTVKGPFLLSSVSRPAACTLFDMVERFLSATTTSITFDIF